MPALWNTIEGNLSAGGASFGWVTGPLKDCSFSSVTLRLTYDVVGAAAWDGLSYELRIGDDTDFTSNGLEAAKGGGVQKTTRAENADATGKTKGSACPHALDSFRPGIRWNRQPG